MPKFKLLNKYLVILRGVSGSGKSTYASKLAVRLYDYMNPPRSVYICSADKFFKRPNGTYDFNPRLLGEAHEWCFEMVDSQMDFKTQVIILDNTNTRRWEYEKYIELANRRGYIVKERIIGKFDEASVKLYASRNQHGVPEESVRKMADRFEIFHADRFIK